MRAGLHLCQLVLLGFVLGQLWPTKAESTECLGRDRYGIELYKDVQEKFNGFTIRAGWDLDENENGFITFHSDPEIFSGTHVVMKGSVILTNRKLCRREEISMQCKFISKSTSSSEHWHCDIEAILEF